MKSVSILILILFFLSIGCVAPSTTVPETPAPEIQPTTPALSPPEPAISAVPNKSISADKIKVHFIDVGQGDAILIETPNKEAVLIDGGDNGKGNTVVSYIQKEGIKDIDVLIATHPDADHIGGLDEVMDSVPVNTVYDGGATKTTQTYTGYITRAKQRNYSIIKRGFNFTLDGVLFQVLNPTTPLKFSTANDNSVVVKATYGSVDSLFTGDCEVECEDDILNAGLDVDSEILKVGHHGSRTSTSQTFLNAVTPDIAVISVGTGNRYGHPHQATLDRLSTNNITYYRTDISSTVVIEANATNYLVK